MSRWRTWGSTWLAVAIVMAAAGAQSNVPELTIEAIDGAGEAEARLRRFDREQLGAVVQLVGLDDPGSPIRVVLAPEASDIARTTQPWIAGFAHSPSSTIVLFPSRSPRYPHDSLEAVLHHEVAHVLISRAANGGQVPRWFHEGLATVAERAWNFEDRRHLAWALASAGPIRMHEVDGLFHAGSGGAARAYAISSAFVRYLIDDHGSDVPARILASIARGCPFEEAFSEASGGSLSQAEGEFHARITSWERWIPLLTSPFVLWSMVTLLALYAIWVARRRRFERRRQWPEEDQEDFG